MNLNRGINLGGYLSQCNHSENHYQSFIEESDIHQIAEWGFDHVRLPIDYEIFEDELGNEKKEGYAYVEKLIFWCQKNQLNIIIDLHKAFGYDFNDAGNSDRNNLFVNHILQLRFLHLWKSIAIAFGMYENVAFELLNEVVEEENASLWNDLIGLAVTEIRKVTKDTPIIYGGIQWNSARTLKLLDIPKEKNIIFTFHFYEPLLFTHQKAHWVEKMDKEKSIFYPESMEYYKSQSEILGYQGETVIKAESKVMGEEFIEEMVLEAVMAAKHAGVGLYCGEFGVINQAPLSDTLQWFKDVDAVFGKYGIGFAVWNYKKMDFGFIDQHYDEIRNDLISLWAKESVAYNS